MNVTTSLVVVGIVLSLVIKATGHDHLAGDVETLGPIKVGASAPTGQVQGLDGTIVDLGQLRGHVVLFEFGATWCGPCRGMLRSLRELSQQVTDGAFKVVSVDVGEGRGDVKKHYEGTSTGNIEILVDEDGAVAKQFGVQAFPTLVLLDAQGIVHLIHVGAVFDIDPVRSAIDKLVKP